MEDIGSKRQRLIELMASKAYLEGDFVLTSGRRSSHYFDLKRLTLDPEGLDLIAWLLVDRLKEAGITAVGGLAIGADPVVAGVVHASWQSGNPIQGFIVRKEPKGHGTGSWIEGPVTPGTAVALVDDVVTSGGSMIRAAEGARAEGLDPRVALAVVDREEGGAENIEAECGLKLQALFKYSELNLAGA